MICQLILGRDLMYGNYKILDKDFQRRYTGLFTQYYIQIMYGNNIVTAESVIAEEENE